MNRVSAAGAPSIDCLPVLVQTRSITASKLARSRPPSVSPNSLDYGLQVHISKLARSCPPSVSPNSLDYSLQVHLHTRLITASKCISKLGRLRPLSVLQTCSITASKFARSWPPSASTHSLDHGLQVHLHTGSIMASECISKLARSRPRSVSLSSLDRHVQAHLELLSSTACSQSRYTVC